MIMGDKKKIAGIILAKKMAIPPMGDHMNGAEDSTYDDESSSTGYREAISDMKTAWDGGDLKGIMRSFKAAMTLAESYEDDDAETGVSDSMGYNPTGGG